MPEPLMIAAYLGGLLVMARSARSGAAAAQRIALDAAERAERQQDRHQERNLAAHLEQSQANIDAQRRNLEDQPAIARRDRAWPLQRPPEDVARFLSRGGVTPLTIFFAPPPGPAARAVHDAAVSVLRRFVREAFGSYAPAVVVSDEWDILAQRALDDAAIGSLAAGLPHHPFVVLSLRYPSPNRVELLAAYHPGGASPIGQAVPLADSPISLRELVADSVRQECDAWNRRALPVAQAAGFPQQAVSELLGPDGVRNLKLKALEDALEKAGIDASSLNLDGRYQSARLEEIVQPALESALQLAAAVLADGHNLLVRGMPPRALTQVVPLVTDAPPALRASTSHVLAVYRSVLQRASATSPEVAAFGLLQLATTQAEIGEMSAAAGAVADALDVWMSMRDLPRDWLDDGRVPSTSARVVELLEDHASPTDAPLIRMFTAALSQMRATADAAALHDLAVRLESEGSSS